ncbi:MAG: hypothetical protein P8X82_09185 [Gemmatimonadales bacterium]
MGVHISRGWLGRLLFVDSVSATSLPAPRAQERMVITALMRRRSGISSRSFRRCIEGDLADKLGEQRGELGLDSVKVFRDVSAGGILSFFLQLTRSHGYTAFLCRVLGRPAPSPYRIPYGTLYDNVVQISFAGKPDATQLKEVQALLRGPDVPAAECTILASDRQYTIYDNGSTRDERERVNICFLVNRPWEMTREACQTYWRTRHADLALRNIKYLGLTRYRQVHTMDSPPLGFDDIYDGIVYAEKSSLARLMFELGKPNSFRFNNTVVIDETHFTECTPIMLLQLASAW